MDSYKPAEFVINSNLSIGLGGITFHGGLIQADSYRLVVSINKNAHSIQAIGKDSVLINLPLSSVTLPKVRRAWWALSQWSNRWTFAFPEMEATWQAKHTS